MIIQPKIIRKSRLTITKRNHRYVGVKVGQLVYYWHKELRQYRVKEIEDCYDWNRKRGRPKREYNRYIWLKPVKKTGPGPRGIDLIGDNYKRHNERVWQSGYIGHSVDYAEVFFTVGEALHSYMKGCY